MPDKRSQLRHVVSKVCRKNQRIVFATREFKVDVEKQGVDVRRGPGDGKQHADEDHRLDEVRLDPVRLARHGARSVGGGVGRHHLRLATYRHQDAAVAEDEYQQNGDVEGQEVPDAVDELGGLALKEDQRVADAVQYGRGVNCHLTYLLT